MTVRRPLLVLLLALTVGCGSLSMDAETTEIRPAPGARSAPSLSDFRSCLVGVFSQIDDPTIENLYRAVLEAGEARFVVKGDGTHSERYFVSWTPGPQVLLVGRQAEDHAVKWVEAWHIAEPIDVFGGASPEGGASTFIRCANPECNKLTPIKPGISGCTHCGQRLK